jgi:hypothetical protein
VWGIVLLTGFIFGISGVKPIPVILTVQALNGLILPLITAFLILIVNDHKLMPKADRHPGWYNFILLLILGSVLLIGLNNVDKAFVNAFHSAGSHFNIVLMLSAGVTGYVALLLINKKQ